jgi:hypothetical protein
VHEQIEVFSSAARKIQSIFCQLDDFQRIFTARMGHPLIKMVRNTAAVFRGMKVFFDVYRSAPKN